jgi:hypothetical protein
MPIVNPLRCRLGTVQAVALVIALTLPGAPAPSAAPALQKLKGIGELKTWFNANAAHPRLIFLLSPT